MKQIGRVVELQGHIVKIECDRQSACDMCENAAGCTEKCKKVYATATNSINAAVGDMVEIETDTKTVLLNAFIVFVLPIFLSVFGYFIFNSLFGEGIAVTATLIVLVFSLWLLSFLLNRRAKNQTISRIVKIL